MAEIESLDRDDLLKIRDFIFDLTKKFPPAFIFRVTSYENDAKYPCTEKQLDFLIKLAETVPGSEIKAPRETILKKFRKDYMADAIARVKNGLPVVIC